ncbi:MAG TPA: hypothetical protein VE172_11640, partial [Stackebrandtia sp.]|uniref:hypothetical protein n=1 Tax=Stackebrandtia sp. TaxID=2023065 RepID=UPI002D50C9D4
MLAYAFTVALTRVLNGDDDLPGVWAATLAIVGVLSGYVVWFRTGALRTVAGRTPYRLQAVGLVLGALGVSVGVLVGPSG